MLIIKQERVVGMALKDRHLFLQLNNLYGRGGNWSETFPNFLYVQRAFFSIVSQKSSTTTCTCDAVGRYP